jgi:hypothetical protein
LKRKSDRERERERERGVKNGGEGFGGKEFEI